MNRTRASSAAVIWMRPALFGAVIFGTTASLFAALPKERGQSQAESQAQSESQAPPGAKAGAGAQRSAADYQPNVELLTQEGKHVRFYDDLVKGRVVLINMMFTTCVSICPPMTANLLKVQRLLEARLGPRLGPRLWQDVRILSISVDPETDTPAVLKEYASRYQVGPGWYFLTGKKPEVDALLAKLGGQDPDKNRHSGMLLIGNDAARSWHKVFAMSEPADIENAVEKLLSLSAASP